MKVLLMGNPNVGKSVIFSKLTGTNVTASNYPGTTVEYTEGQMKYEGENIEIIDVPGTYTLDPTNQAEEVAVDMIEKGDLIINVVDATNLERHLNLTLQLLEKDVPVIVALNLWDETKHRGIDINLDKLKKELGVPVIPTVAIKSKGIKELINNFDYREVVDVDYGTSEKRWTEIGKIIDEVQKIEKRRHTFLELIEEYTIKPLTGIPFMFLVLYLTFKVIRFIGEGLIGYVTEPFFMNIYKPFLLKLSDFLGSGGIIHDILVGQLVEGSINLEQSFGLLSTAVFIPFSAVLPYIIAFYLVLGILEDSGYLPRMAVLVDNVMHKVGLHGFSIIPMILGLGCNVPAALSVRSLESKREKFIASTLMAISIPCMAQIAMIFGLLGPFGGQYVIYVFAMLVFVWIIVGLILNKLLPGYSNDLLLEVPAFRVPDFLTIFKKLWMRIISFLREAVPYMLFGVIIVNFLYTIGIFEVMTNVLGPIIQNIFGLPREAISALLMGFLRKDLAMGMLAPLGLTAKQLVVASTILAVYFPCIATFVVLVRELGIIDMFKSVIIMLISTVVFGGFINFAFQDGKIGISSWLLLVAIVVLLRYLPNNKGRA